MSPAETHATRRARLATFVAERTETDGGGEIDLVLVSDLLNVRWLTGFTGSNGALLVWPDGTAVLATDGRYAEQAAEQCPGLPLRIGRDLTALVTEAAGFEAHRCAVETHVLSVDDFQELSERAPSWQLVPAGRAVEALRVVKDELELAAITRACTISTQALSDLWAGPLVGRTEREVARDLEWRLYGGGAEAIAFDTIVAAGPHSAVPHHEPTDRPLRAGDLLKVDFGARVDGYCADCTRTVALRSSADWQREAHAVVEDVQSYGVRALVPGAPVADIDSMVRERLGGWATSFTTGLGHGIGLAIHEDPFLSPLNAGRLARRTPVTMEPGVYLPGRGGVRIEDTVVVDDSPLVLTDLTTELLVVG
jgi:Xaa-Pro aminopeptidase